MGEPNLSRLLISEFIAYKSEPRELKHLGKDIPLVAASERGTGQCYFLLNQNCMGRQAIVSDSLVWVDSKK